MEVGNNFYHRILRLLKIDYVISIDIFETRRIIQRGNLKILQQLNEETYAGGGNWEDIKIIY